MREIHMISMWVSLQAKLHVCQGNVVHLRRSHDIRPQIEQQVVIDQSRGPLSQTFTANSRAVWQLPHLQKASGNAFAAAVPRNVSFISCSIAPKLLISFAFYSMKSVANP